jgi:hypothetical protein
VFVVVYLKTFFCDQDYIPPNERMISKFCIGKDLERSSRGLLKNYSGIRLEIPRKTMKNLGYDSRYLGKDLKAGPLRYKTGVLTL